MTILSVGSSYSSHAGHRQDTFCDLPSWWREPHQFADQPVGEGRRPLSRGRGRRQSCWCLGSRRRSTCRRSEVHRRPEISWRAWSFRTLIRGAIVTGHLAGAATAPLPWGIRGPSAESLHGVDRCHCERSLVGVSRLSGWPGPRGDPRGGARSCARWSARGGRRRRGWIGATCMSAAAVAVSTRIGSAMLGERCRGRSMPAISTLARFARLMSINMGSQRAPRSEDRNRAAHVVANSGA